MIKNKKGFSLAEILLTVGIVSVIAVIGFTATKKSVESAYNLYIYTGYKGLTDAIRYANTQDQPIGNGIQNSQQFFNNFSTVLNATIEYPQNGTQAIITAPNGVRYTFTDLQHYSNPANSIYYYRILFEVPCKRFVLNNSAYDYLSFDLNYYYHPDSYDIILPVSGVDNNGSGKNILTRKDLLPFYIDDGNVGRVVAGEYQSKTYLSWQEAWCSNPNPNMADNKIPDIDSWTCEDFPENDETGTLKLENPRKAF